MRKIRIRRLDLTIVLYRQSGQVGIADQVGTGLDCEQHAPKDFPVALGGLDNTCTRLIKPACHSLHGLINRKRPCENPGVGSNSDKGRNHRPAQAYPLAPGKLGIPPDACSLMQRAQPVFGIEEDIGINQDQRKESPSASANSSWMLSRL